MRWRRRLKAQYAANSTNTMAVAPPPTTPPINPASTGDGATAIVPFGDDVPGIKTICGDVPGVESFCDVPDETVVDNVVASPECEAVDDGESLGVGELVVRAVDEHMPVHMHELVAIEQFRQFVSAPCNRLKFETIGQRRNREY